LQFSMQKEVRAFPECCSAQPERTGPKPRTAYPPNFRPVTSRPRAVARSVSGANFPLSTYSVFGKKNVSQENENIFAGLRNLGFCPLLKDKLHPLVLQVIVQASAEPLFSE